MKMMQEEMSLLASEAQLEKVVAKFEGYTQLESYNRHRMKMEHEINLLQV